MILQKSGKQHWLSVPKDVIDSRQWEKGDSFVPVLLAEEDGIKYVRIRNKEGVE